jgi:hypothetical protein
MRSYRPPIPSPATRPEARDGRARAARSLPLRDRPQMLSSLLPPHPRCRRRLARRTARRAPPSGRSAALLAMLLVISDAAQAAPTVTAVVTLQVIGRRITGSRSATIPLPAARLGQHRDRSILGDGDPGRPRGKLCYHRRSRPQQVCGNRRRRALGRSG